MKSVSRKSATPAEVSEKKYSKSDNGPIIISRRSESIRAPPIRTTSPRRPLSEGEYSSSRFDQNPLIPRKSSQRANPHPVAPSSVIGSKSRPSTPIIITKSPRATPVTPKKVTISETYPRVYLQYDPKIQNALLRIGKASGDFSLLKTKDMTIVVPKVKKVNEKYIKRLIKSFESVVDSVEKFGKWKEHKYPVIINVGTDKLSPSLTLAGGGIYPLNGVCFYVTKDLLKAIIDQDYTKKNISITFGDVGKPKEYEEIGEIDYNFPFASDENIIEFISKPGMLKGKKDLDLSVITSKKLDTFLKTFDKITVKAIFKKGSSVVVESLKLIKASE